MKLLFVNKYYPPWRGGIETVTKQVAQGLANFPDTEVDVLVCAPLGQSGFFNIQKDTRVHGAKSFGHVLGMPLSFDFFRQYKKLAGRSDIIILNHPFPLGFLCYLLFSKNKPCLVWYHADITRQKISLRLFRPILRKVLRNAKKIIVSDMKVAESSSELRPFYTKCQAVPYGVDLEFFQMTDQLRKQANDIQGLDQKPIILSAGRLVPYKGFNFLVAAMKEVDARLFLVGSGPLKNELIQLAQNLGVSDKMKIFEGVEDLRPFYFASNIFVLPSITIAEAFGIVQIEAMACGLPVINTNLPTAVPVISKDGETGLTVPPSDSSALASAINRLLSDQDFRSKCAENAKVRAKLFTEAKMVHSVYEVLASIYGK